MALHWLGSSTREAGYRFGSLALVAPILERMDLAGIINRHLPADPQAEYAYGPLLSLLVAARLANPVALVNVADWAAEAGAELLWDIPPDKLTDDRLGRALDAFYYQRHSIRACLALHVAQTFNISLDRLHYDPTHIICHGSYEQSRPRADPAPDRQRPYADDPPAHITFGHAVPNTKMIHAGLCVAIDDLGAVPVLGHVTDGNHNGHTSIAEQCALLKEQLPPGRRLLISDRGTFSARHVARCQQDNVTVLCSAPWNDYRALYDQHRHQLQWQKASYLSIEQRRRRDCASTLPLEHYELAVLRHHLIDPDTAAEIPCRVIFVFSTADAKVCQTTRAQTVARLQSGLQQLARSVNEGRRHTDPTSVARRIAKLFGQRGAAAYFHWELQPLTPDEQAALPPPTRGCRLPTHRLVYHYDAARAEADAAYDGLSVLVTTAPRIESADVLFSQFKQQNEVELAHHQWKTPLAVHPVFLKNPRRVEALVHLLMIALTAYYLVQRQYRQAVEPDAPETEKRTTTETLFRAFRNYTLLVERRPYGHVVHTTVLTQRQRQILQRLNVSTPAELLSRKLPKPPTEAAQRASPLQC
jgi:transposase